MLGNGNDTCDFCEVKEFGLSCSSISTWSSRFKSIKLLLLSGDVSVSIVVIVNEIIMESSKQQNQNNIQIQYENKTKKEINKIKNLKKVQ